MKGTARTCVRVLRCVLRAAVKSLGTRGKGAREDCVGALW